jgi:hypothetical protein
MPSREPTPTLFDAVRGQAASDELLDDDVLFRSPFADYRGRADVAHLVGLIAQVVHDVQAHRSLHDGTSRMTVFTAHVDGGQPAQGALWEEHDGSGAVVEAMLTVRPLSALHVAMGGMRDLLTTSPLPGSSR